MATYNKYDLIDQLNVLSGWTASTTPYPITLTQTGWYRMRFTGLTSNWAVVWKWGAYNLLSSGNVYQDATPYLKMNAGSGYTVEASGFGPPPTVYFDILAYSYTDPDTGGGGQVPYPTAASRTWDGSQWLPMGTVGSVWNGSTWVRP